VVRPQTSVATKKSSPQKAQEAQVIELSNFVLCVPSVPFVALKILAIEIV
jgi:hypothetical protein